MNATFLQGHIQRRHGGEFRCPPWDCGRKGVGWWSVGAHIPPKMPSEPHHPAEDGVIPPSAMGDPHMGIGGFLNMCVKKRGWDSDK